MNTKGKLIVIEGADGSGKATQTKLLVEHLVRENIPQFTIDFPQYDNNIFGGFIKECLKGEHGDFVGFDPYIASIPYACDRFESKSKIIQALERGEAVVMDRYVSANQIHQGGKIKVADAREKYLKWIDKVEHEVFGLPRPDLIIYLDVPYSIVKNLVQERITKEGGARDLVEENAEYLINSQKAALDIVMQNGSWTKVSCADGEVMMSRESIHEKIWEKVKNII
ncbi:MAG: deoxynucleoside kinase [Patescibacteria group bacterium]